MLCLILRVHTIYNSCVEEGMAVVLSNVKIPLAPSQAWGLTEGGLLRATSSSLTDPLVVSVAP